MLHSVTFESSHYCLDISFSAIVFLDIDIQCLTHGILHICYIAESFVSFVRNGSTIQYLQGFQCVSVRIGAQRICKRL